MDVPANFLIVLRKRATLLQEIPDTARVPCKEVSIFLTNAIGVFQDLTTTTND